MQPSSDSIQTLLRQRRQLRDCLQDLKSEISRLNTKAHSMTGVSFDGTSLKTENLTAEEPRLEAVGADEGEVGVEAKRMLHTAPGSTAAEPATIFKKISSEDLLSEPGDQHPILPTPVDVPTTAPDRPTNKPSAAKVDSLPASDEGVPSSPTFDVDLDQAVKPRPALNTRVPEVLIEQAILLAGFCLHHPSAAGNQLLNRLDTAIQQIKQMPQGVRQADALDALKNAYRDVVERTYPTSKISGKTLVESQQPNTLLWGLPMIIAALVLVVLPAFMLLQVMAGQSLTARISHDTVLIVGGLIAFTWGIAGGLSFLTVLIAAAIRRGSFTRHMATGMGLQAMMGGLAGLISYAMFIFVSSGHNVTGDIVNALIAFGAGLLGGGGTYLIISRKSAL